MTEHTLKIQPQPFADLLSGDKTGEVRRCDDRDFQVGDTVLLMELREGFGNQYSGRTLRRSITHIQHGYGLPDELCVLSYAATPSEDGGEVPEVVAHRPRPVLFSSDGELLMTVAQHSRIVSAKDAEIASERELRRQLSVRVHELKDAAKAQPARQVGDDAGRAGREQDEREACALQRHLLEHCRDVRPLHAGLMGWALAALTARQVGGDERECQFCSALDYWEKGKKCGEHGGGSNGSV